MHLNPRAESNERILLPMSWNELIDRASVKLNFETFARTIGKTSVRTTIDKDAAICGLQKHRVKGVLSACKRS